MLSYIYRIVCEFKKNHHCQPNVLYLNNEQFHQLRRSFSNPDDTDTMSRLLQMHIIISHDALHPHLARIENRWSHSDQLPHLRSEKITTRKNHCQKYGYRNKKR